MVFPTAYLAPVGYYRKRYACRRNDEAVCVDVREHFPKQTYRNRCTILGVNGVQTLSIPVEKCERKQCTQDVKITYQLRWQHQHWHSLTSAYRHSAFFNYYADFFQPFYLKRYTWLVDFNDELNALVENLLFNSVSLSSGNVSLREYPISHSVQWCEEDLETTWDAEQRPYHQLFAQKRTAFEENLSIVDLLFNCGAQSINYLK